MEEDCGGVATEEVSGGVAEEVASQICIVV